MTVAESIVDGFLRELEQHATQSGHSLHKIHLRTEGDGSLTLYCETCQRGIGRKSGHVPPDIRGEVHLLF